ncbi:hypothetical protein DWW31_03820 [Clostridium sp. AF15-17LB]|nr:hypothetical protein DWW31_03820 [Clostridium sp. AF15-17LB]
MRKLGKKKILSLLTAVAIVATTVGSFAVWDTLSTESTGTLTVTSPIVVKTEDIANFAESKNADTGVPTYTASVKFDVDGLADYSGKQLTLDCAIKDGSNVDQTGKFDVAITGVGVTGNVDSSVEASNTYSVAITPKDNADAKALAGQSLDVGVTATLGDTSSNP